MTPEAAMPNSAHSLGSPFSSGSGGSSVSVGWPGSTGVVSGTSSSAISVSMRCFALVGMARKKKPLMDDNCLFGRHSVSLRLLHSAGRPRAGHSIGIGTTGKALGHLSATDGFSFPCAPPPGLCCLGNHAVTLLLLRQVGPVPYVLGFRRRRN